MTARKTKATKKKSSRKKTPPRSPRAKRSRRKPPKGEPDRGGRPAIEWNDQVANDVNRLARAGNTVEDMAWILDVGKRALEAALADDELPLQKAYRSGLAERRDHLRTAQLRSALSGNARMLVWLGKQDLGQRDVKAVEITSGDGPVRLEADLGPIVKRKLTEYLRSRGK